MGACVSSRSSYRVLDLQADSFTVTVKEPGTVSFFAFDLPKPWLRNKLDLVVRVHVERGRLSGVYCARDGVFPKQRRRIWSTDRYCACPSPTCDHCYPHCLNDSGGLCITCMTHDEQWSRASHDPALGGSAAEADETSESGGGGGGDGMVGVSGVVEASGVDPSLTGGASATAAYKHQTDYEFSLRLVTSDSKQPPLRPGRYLLSIEAAQEQVSRALRKQRRLEGEEERHSTAFTLWIEERAPKHAKPETGNDERALEAREAREKRKAQKELRATFGRKVDDFARQRSDAEKEAKERRDRGLPSPIAQTKTKKKTLEILPATDLASDNAAAAAAATDSPTSAAKKESAEEEEEQKESPSSAADTNDEEEEKKESSVVS